jgi:three-Cys-motif partner protein
LKNPSDFVSDITRTLLELAKAYASDNLATIDYGAYTILKLICVYYYAGWVTRIANGPRATLSGCDGAVYVDLFAGPGIVRIRETGDIVAGSPIAVASTNPPFDYSFFVEVDRGRREALESRLRTILPRDKYQVIPYDCNQLIQTIVDQINKRFKKPIVFAFVDPEGMEIKWKTVECLSSAFKSADFMINVNSGAARLAGRMNTNDTRYNDRPIFEDFFQNAKAEEVLIRINSGIGVEKIYEDGVRQTLGRPIGKTIPIRDKGGITVYNILAYTRKNPSGSQWAKAFAILEQNLRYMDGGKVKSMLDVIQGREGSLNQYFGQ